MDSIPPIIRYKTKSKPYLGKYISLWHYLYADFDKAAELIDMVDWDTVIPNNTDVDSSWSLTI